MVVLFALAALAGTPGYQACCKASDNGPCPQTLQLSGPGSTQSTESGAIRISGLWSLKCEGGAKFEPGATNVMMSAPSPGSVLTPITQTDAACFDAACALPPTVCLRHDGSRAMLVECASGIAAPAEALAQTAIEDSRAVVIDKHVVIARDALPTRGAPAVAAGPAAVSTAPATVAAPPAAPASSSVDTKLPATPPQPCRVQSGLRDASSSQVDAGNELAMKSDFGGAISKYKAAITINGCNAFAWADMGEAYLSVGENPTARDALEIATTLMPTHYQAWANLGRAREAMGLANAPEAYQKALEIQPGYLPASDGLARTRH